MSVFRAYRGEEDGLFRSALCFPEVGFVLVQFSGKFKVHCAEPVYSSLLDTSSAPIQGFPPLPSPRTTLSLQAIAIKPFIKTPVQPSSPPLSSPLLLVRAIALQTSDTLPENPYPQPHSQPPLPPSLTRRLPKPSLPPRPTQSFHLDHHPPHSSHRFPIPPRRSVALQSPYTQHLPKSKHLHALSPSFLPLREDAQLRHSVQACCIARRACRSC